MIYMHTLYEFHNIYSFFLMIITVIRVYFLEYDVHVCAIKLIKLLSQPKRAI